MREIEHWIEEAVGLTAITQENILSSLLVLLGLWLLSRILLRVVSRREQDSRKLYQWKKTTNYVVTGLGILLLINIWFNGFQPIATFLGLLSAGLVVALRDPIMNMFGWVFLIWKRPFKVGDRIKVNEHTGDVIDIKLFQFTLNELGVWVDSEQATGRIVHIPNSHVFTRALINYNYGFPFLWHEVQVRITFESNWQKAKSILEEIGAKYSVELSEAAQQRIRVEAQRHLIFYNNYNARVYTKVRENGIQLTIRYLSNVSGRRESENKIWQDVLTQFMASPDIRFAYPTTRFYQSPGDQEQEQREGSSGLLLP
ncbi:mechanosensitive ion channel family protein [Pontibacter sp. SGAir0037]|uniref:mechanosensitive ion channel family protein n=1 Tax=Pontibacter sp. SGAir0037 TaxID=2571030 RepID=UPI0010CD5D4E|nr:mechanosensitive ion channel domain-containing protein [Pontibacter sp. SGAir0037]QCR24126.1 mechanosensitive ion channel protein MscS [Pontibacter sp. SGAir0037]